MATEDDTLIGGSGRGDTSPDAERVQMAILRSLPVSHRLAQADQLYELTTALAQADVRRRHPGASEEELRRRLAERRRSGDSRASERA